MLSNAHFANVLAECAFGESFFSHSFVFGDVTNSIRYSRIFYSVHSVFANIMKYSANNENATFVGTLVCLHRLFSQIDLKFFLFFFSMNF